MAEPAAPRIFISYSHDSEAHVDRVLALADQLVADGIDASIDQYIQSPPEGWSDWCEAEIRKADFVLMVCTETYLKRVNREEQSGKGHGVLWEVRIIRQHLYDSGAVTNKFVPVLFADGSPDNVPTPVKGATIYRVESPTDYELLYRLVTDQPLVRKPKLGILRRLPERPRQSLGEPSVRAAIEEPQLATAALPQPQAKNLSAGQEQKRKFTGKTAGYAPMVIFLKSIYRPISTVLALVAAVTTIAVGWVTLVQPEHRKLEAVRTPTYVPPVKVSPRTQMREGSNLGRPERNSHTVERHSDVLLQNSRGEVRIWQLNGTEVIDSTSLGNPGPSWHAIASGGLNDDGSIDLLWQNVSGEVAIWRLDGINLTVSSSIGNLGSDWHAFKSGGLNDHLLWQNVTCEVTVWQLNGTKVIGRANLGNPGPDWHAIGSGGLNDEGSFNLLWQNVNGEIAIWKLNGTNVTDKASLGNPGPDWRAVSVGDYSSATDSAIGFRNTNGEVSMWKLNGSKIISSSILGNRGPDWHIVGLGDYVNGILAIYLQNDNGEVEILSPSVIGSLGSPGPGLRAIGSGDCNPNR